MKALEAGYATHIASGATTLAYCWRLARADGMVLGFTDHDRTLHFDETDFVPAHGLDGSEVPAKFGAQVDTAEVLGVLHADAITETDIALGRYDGAGVETFRVNWRDTSQRDLLRHDTIGEIVREDGVFRAELRSGQQALNQVKGRVYQRLCNASLGDSQCGIDLEISAYRGFATVTSVEGRFRLGLSGLDGFDPGWFDFGHAVWASGQRIGLRDSVLSQTRLGGVDLLEFSMPVGDWASAGDELTVYAGCDRRFDTCRQKFGNGVNFRGFPHIPGSDYVLRYPRQGDALDGRAVVR
ncbi:DUF2163 domain-containing protein [Devosia rhodophyticola]|uniref:DUF2163 domain-containing protein n=1 Tax=Devosia rhodophyticola TaxID=3026423 RepID=A0ABY7YYS3_9HYPH|nr:DUF2163 domain-containing protein [Devosia rhodophyticola]WDR06394.1 DUF2163 domain-containing protein [Devosia rhodophyticola]